MLITREMMVKKLSEKSGYWQKDIRAVLQCLDDVVLECFSEVTDDEDTMIQLVSGVRIGCSIQPERNRKDPRTQEDIVCKPRCKPKSKFSEDFRQRIQENYEASKNEK